MAYQLPILTSDPPPSPPATLRVGELAKLSGKTVRALHLYEERGLLEPAQRSSGGYRLYGEDAVTRVRWIAKMQDVGYSLSALQKMMRELDSRASAPDAMARIDTMLRQRLETTRAQIERLRSLEGELQASLEYLQTCPSCHPQVDLEECPACERHEAGVTAPELVAGFHVQDSSRDPVALKSTQSTEIAE